LSEIRIISPESGDRVEKDQPYDIHCAQQGVHGMTAGLQMSPGPPNPDDPPEHWQWLTCRSPGGGGTVECAPVPYSGQSPEFHLEAISHGRSWIRAGVWVEDWREEPIDPPTEVSLPVKVLVLTSTPAPAPEGRPRR
jgi:hypothetical protein